MSRYFQSECIDKHTGRSFRLRLFGTNPEEARSAASAWGFITSTPELAPFERERSDGKTMTTRHGKRVVVGEVFHAWCAGELVEMIRVRNQDCHLVDRHHFLQRLADSAYKLRDSRSDALTWCEWACWQWLMLAPLLIDAMRREHAQPGEFVSIGVPKRLLILLEKAGNTERAAEVARACQRIGLKQDDVDYLAGKWAQLEKALTKR